MLGSTNSNTSKLNEPLVHTHHSYNKVVLDTGATHHFFSSQPTPPHDLPLSDIRPVSNGINVLLPNHDRIQATHKANLDLPHLPSAARDVHLFPSLASGSLMSIGQLCDSGCTATFTNTSAVITRQGKTVITGHRNPMSKLWELRPSNPSSTPITPSINSTIGSPSATARIRFYHAALFSPSLSTLQKTLDAGYLSSIPGLTSTSLRRHPPISEDTIKGHLNAQRQHVRSTKRSYTTPHYIYSASASPSARTTPSIPTVSPQQAESTPTNQALSSLPPPAVTNTSL